MKRYPVASFFVLAFLLGAGMITLVFQGIVPPQLALTSALSVTIAVLLMTAILEGKPGLSALFRRILIWRVTPGYWFFALFFLVPVIILGSLINPLFNGDAGSFQDLRLSPNLILFFLAFTITASLGQELGWSGFLLPRLQARYNALPSSLVRAALVFLWHIPLLIYTYYHPEGIPDFPYGGWMVQKGVLNTILAMVALSLPWSILTTWMFNNTRGSLLLVSILHSSEFWLAILLPSLGINTKDLNNYWGYGILMLFTAASLLVIYGPQNLSRNFQRIQDN
jgi:membrane protease YdiL (CAAX protease family)